jgi:hypothetical protein
MMQATSRSFLVVLMFVMSALSTYAWDMPEWRLPSLRMPKMPQMNYQPSKAFALDGYIDHTTTFVSDSSRAGSFEEDLLLHSSRLMLGAKGEIQLAGQMNYLLRLGGSFAQNSLYEQRILTPEVQADVNWQPLQALQLGAFARYGWRRPNTFMVDSLTRRDFVAGLRMGVQPMKHTELSLLFGNRFEMTGDDESGHKFFKGELEQRLPFLNDFLIRVAGESDWYGLADSLTFDHQRTLASLSLVGELPGGVHLNSRSAYVYRDGVKRILGTNRVRAKLYQHHRLSANASADFTEQEERRIYRRLADASWRYMPWHSFGAELKLKNERVHVEGTEGHDVIDEDWDHRRSVELGVLWDLKPLQRWAERIEASGRHEGWHWKNLFHKGVWAKRNTLVRGHVSGGFAETQNYGKGPIGTTAFELIQPVELASWLSVSMRELAEVEFFNMNDKDLIAPDEKAEQVEAENLLQFKTTLFPKKSLQLGHRISWRRHVGTAFMFSEDTLRNTVNNELWVKWRRNRFQVSLSGMQVDYLTDHPVVEREQRIALRLRYQPMRSASVNVQTVLRPAVDALDARLWTRFYAEFDVNKLTLTADLRFSGDPDDFGERDTQAWIHVLRRLW